jgi:hypothetical protein|tara:strand:- start:10651 stop:11820 length:1170 start_codon:yes stop_codon:yes gene_type:complete
MPRISLYKPERGNDYNFLDKQIQEMFTVGGTDINIHKYLGTEVPSDDDRSATQPEYDAVAETNIQDLLFLENRDRKYDPDIYTMRAIYNVQDIDFDLSQFGMFLSNDTLFMTIHINSSVKTLGRKIMSGDVIELPHLKDEYALNDAAFALKRFYVVDDVNRAAEGFSQTWYPHLYRLKLKQIVDSQEFAEILDLPAEEGSDNTLRDLLSTYEKEMQISNAVVAQAEADAPKSGFDISHYYSLATNEDGSVALRTADQGDIDASNVNTNADEVTDRPDRSGYTGYLVGQGDNAPNGAPFGFGIKFPVDHQEGDYFLRTDFLPNRMFKYDGIRWVKVEDDIRMTLSNTLQRQTYKTEFINNTNTNNIDGEVVEERQSLSKALRPRTPEADN